jgi:hypothetical protein
MSCQLLVFIAYNLIPRDKKEGWHLLHCLHSFAIIDLYLSFEVHTEQTLAAGWHELRNFAQRMRVCIPFILSMLFIYKYLLFVLARNISMYLMQRQKARVNMGNHGTSPKCTHWCIALITSMQRGPLGIITQSQMKSSTGHSRRYI